MANTTTLPAYPSRKKLSSLNDYIACALPTPNKVFSQKVMAILEDDHAKEFPTVHDCAYRLEISLRSLQRKLEHEHTSFAKLRDTVRYKQALTLLATTELNLIQIAKMVGYGDRGSLNSSVKRWTGKTPRDFREHIQKCA